MKPLNKIVVVGGGSAGWMAAAILASHLKRDLCQIELVESEEIGTIGIGESTVPSFVTLLQRLGVDEQEFIRETQATYKLGIRFVDWHQRGKTYFHPFGTIGKRIGNHDFYQCWLKARAQGDTSSLLDFSPCSVMADNGRFFPPAKARNTPIGGANYALHVDAHLVANYLRHYAEALGVKRTEGKVCRVTRADNGFINSVILANEREVDGDFFIDCTGFKALLIDKNLSVGLEDWSDFLPCDRAIAVRAENNGPILPYTLATARQAGWSWRIPLQQRVGHGYVYASRFCSDSVAKTTLTKIIDGRMLEESRIIPFVTGRRRESWKHNCLALGLAAGFIEPLESTTLHLIARGMDFFLRYFPDQDCDPALIKEYNRRIAADYEEVRDFIVLHYAATQREDTAFWRWCKNLELPDSLQARIELFKAHGNLREGVDELFRGTSWQSVFEGMGIRPAKYCPRVNNMDYQQINQTLTQAKSAIQGMVKALPTHDEYLRSLTGNA